MPPARVKDTALAIVAAVAKRPSLVRVVPPLSPLVIHSVQQPLNSYKHGVSETMYMSLLRNKDQIVHP